MVMSLGYCLVYRMSVIMEDQRFHEFLVSKAGFAASIPFGLLMGGSTAALAYGIIDVTQ
ncbi:hypothetical protein AAVH_40571, partial [Aphelenchoides avenae]